jgi:hypothetical protein
MKYTARKTHAFQHITEPSSTMHFAGHTAFSSSVNIQIDLINTICRKQHKREHDHHHTAYTLNPQSNYTKKMAETGVKHDKK